jgi:uncharacterized membrane protein YjgN (DUF898 family)
LAAGLGREPSPEAPQAPHLPPSLATGLPRLPPGIVASWPVRFRAEAADYVPLWWRNLILILLTAGLYLPWARVQSRRFFMRHTRVAGHRLDYHETPWRLLPRYALGACLLLGVGAAWVGSPMAGMLAFSLALAAWPLLMFMSLTQQVAHISWARRRVAFDGVCLDVYRAMWAPLAGGGAAAWLLMLALIWQRPPLWLAFGGIAALWVLAMPVFVWAWFSFRQRQFRLGPVAMRWQGSQAAVHMVFVRTLAWAMLSTVCSLGVAAVLLALVLKLHGRPSPSAQLILLAAAGLAVCAAVLPFWQARLQNLVWNKSGSRELRFRSRLKVSGFVKLQCRHALLLVLTLGLYWPWAVVATRRMRVQALRVCARVDADVLKAHWPTHMAAQAAKMSGSPAR